MSNFPGSYDDDLSLPFVNNNLTEIGSEAINSLRDAVFQIEQEIGLGASGTSGSIAQRLGISILPDGTINPSAIASLGLVTLPITNSQIIDNANIPESKLRLDYRTADLFNYIRENANNINSALNWMTLTGIKLDPHLFGVMYRHDLAGIDVSLNPANYLYNRYGLLRDNVDCYNLINDINNELLAHQFADSFPVTSSFITTNDGSTYSANYAHPASGIYVNTSRFSIIPETKTDLQQLMQYIDDSSMFLYGSRIQNLYSNGISKASRSSRLDSQTLGTSIIPETPVVVYLLGSTGASSSPVDNISYGDDLIEFKPLSGVTSTFTFDTQFSLVKPGDIIKITYAAYGNHGAVEVSALIKEKKFVSGSPGSYLVRIANKNLFYSPDGYATAQINKSPFNINKYGVLATSVVNHAFYLPTSIMPSLIIGSPRNAMALGLGFNPALLDSSHYNLYLALYPTGNPADGYVRLPAIDVTGNAGTRPGTYTLSSVIDAMNERFRAPGYNYRFMAFEYQGEIGIMMTDCYNNASFSIINAVVDSAGAYNELSTNIEFPNNVVGVFATSPLVAPDPLGFGAYGSGIASPLYQNSYASSEASQVVTKIFSPLSRNNYYVNGIEKDKLTTETNQTLDDLGDGYWIGDIVPGSYVETPGVRTTVTYRINNLSAEELASTGLKEGKTLVVQSLGQGTIKDYGRYIIEAITFGCGANDYTDIKVYDAVHSTGLTPNGSSSSGRFAIYFNSSSVSFNNEHMSDYSTYSSFKRHFEVFIDENAKTFTSERGRINVSGVDATINGIPLRSTSLLSNLNIIRISPKLRGYQFGSITKISLRLMTFEANGDFSGYLVSYDGSQYSKYGPLTYGRKGEIVRFYDETNIDYIDIMFELWASLSLPIVTPELIDIQLFPSLSLDDEVMMISTCQHNTLSNKIEYLRDERQFGNIGEKEFSTSALNFMSLPDKLMHQNGVLRGFDLQTVPVGTNPNDNQIYLQGGAALVSGKIVYKNAETINVPKLDQFADSAIRSIDWALCVNSQNEYQLLPLLDKYSDRVFLARNPVTGVQYNLEASYFVDIINNRKDLTVLYIVESSVSVGGGVATSTLTMKDVRKYNVDIEANVPLRFNLNANQANFKNIDSIFNWLNYNSQYNGHVIIRGIPTTLAAPYGASVTGGLRIPNTLISTASRQIVIDGEKDANLNILGENILGSNVTFKNINLRFSDTLTILPNTQNLKFENCNIILDYTVSTFESSIINFQNASNIEFNNCNITVLSDSALGRIIFGFDSCNNIKFINTTITGLFYKAISIYGTSSNFTIDGCTITSSFIPLEAYGNFTASNLINSGYGYISAMCNTTISDIKITRTTFNYSPTSASSDRYSFINFELNTSTSKLLNLEISNCKFNNTNQNTSTEDIRAAISIINVVAVNTNDAKPLLSNCLITQNECNTSQAIFITSKTNNAFTPARMSYPGLVATNVTISNNSCGTIGYWIASGEESKYVTIPPTANPNNYNTKIPGLNIIGNTCHYIMNCDHLGKFFTIAYAVRGESINSVTMSSYPSASVSIVNNKANWINVSKSYQSDSELIIEYNTLIAYNDLYVKQFNNDLLTNNKHVPFYIIGDTDDRVSCAIYVGSNPYNSLSISEHSSNCFISKNSINSGTYYINDNTIVTYTYQVGIYCEASNIISNNIIKGIAEEDLNREPSGILGIGVGGLNNIITNNMIYRGLSNVYAYIFVFNGTFPVWDFSGSSGIITDNYFDNYYVTNGDESTINVISGVPESSSTTRWIVERNINQTVTRLLRLMSARHLATNNISYPDIWQLPSAFSVHIDSVEYNSITLRSSNSDQKYYTVLYDLTHMLPNNITLTSASVIVTCNAHTAGSGIEGKLLIKNSLGSKEEYITYTFSTAGETHTLSITEPTINNYINDVNGYLFVSLIMMISTTGSPTTTVNISGFEIQYRW